MEAIEKSLGREELRNRVPEMFLIVTVTLNLGSTLIISFLFSELFNGDDESSSGSRGRFEASETWNYYTSEKPASLQLGTLSWSWVL